MFTALHGQAVIDPDLECGTAPGSLLVYVQCNIPQHQASSLVIEP